MPNTTHKPTKSQFGFRAAALKGVILTLTGLLVFLPSYALAGNLTHDEGILLRSAVAVLLAAVCWKLNRVPCRRDWARIAALFLVANLGLLVSWIFASPLQSLFAADLATPRGIALAKLSETLPVVVVIFLVLHTLRIRPAEVQIRRGRLIMGLTIGAGFFVAFSLLAALYFGPAVTLELLVAQAPWLLIFVFTNAFGEELLFRGLFLRAYENVIGSGNAILATAVVFAMIHLGVDYAPNMPGFVALTFVLGLIWGFLVKKTESLWCSVIFHAGADVMIFAPIVIGYANRGSG
jgi:membrane protease YdiL (CAAX protease family)